MYILNKRPIFKIIGQYGLVSIILTSVLLSILIPLPLEKAMADVINLEENLSSLQIVQETTLLPSAPCFLENPPKKIKVIVTAYSSSSWETDDNPYITASGSYVKEGIVANNILPFGTKIRLPEVFGDKIFIVEDRMHWRKDNYHIDIWSSSYEEAKNFGAKITEMEILNTD